MGGVAAFFSSLPVAAALLPPPNRPPKGEEEGALAEAVLGASFAFAGCFEVTATAGAFGVSAFFAAPPPNKPPNGEDDAFAFGAGFFSTAAVAVTGATVAGEDAATAAPDLVRNGALSGRAVTLGASGAFSGAFFAAGATVFLAATPPPPPPPNKPPKGEEGFFSVAFGDAAATAVGCVLAEAGASAVAGEEGAVLTVFDLVRNGALSGGAFLAGAAGAAGGAGALGCGGDAATGADFATGLEGAFTAGSGGIDALAGAAAGAAAAAGAVGGVAAALAGEGGDADVGRGESTFAGGFFR